MALIAELGEGLTTAASEVRSDHVVTHPPLSTWPSSASSVHLQLGPRRSAVRSSARVLVRLAMVFAGDVRIVLSEHAAWILAMHPDMTIVVRLEHMALVERRGWVVLHQVVRNPLVTWWTFVASSFPGTHECQILDGDEFE